MHLFFTILGVSILIGILCLIATDEMGGVGTAVFIISMIIGIVVSDPLDTVTTTDTQEIITLRDNSSMKGGFFLGCGNIEGTMKYSFYYKTNNNSYMLKSLDCSRVELIYSTDTPQLITKITRADTNSKRNNWRLRGFSTRRHYYIKIPKGSIASSYILDAQ